MNTTKNNIRSFRYSDRVAEILKSFDGNSLNEKFENLVRYCYDAVPEKKKELKNLDKAIEDKKKAYFRACQQLKDVQELMNTIKTLQHYGEIATQKAELVFKEQDV